MADMPGNGSADIPARQMADHGALSRHLSSTAEVPGRGLRIAESVRGGPSLPNELVMSMVIHTRSRALR